MRPAYEQALAMHLGGWQCIARLLALSGLLLWLTIGELYRESLDILDGSHHQGFATTTHGQCVMREGRYIQVRVRCH
jgi:hypothetical protein